MRADSAFEDLHLVAVGIGDEGHFAAAGGEFFAPAGRPDVEAGFFELIAVIDDVRHAEGGVHQIFRAGGLIVLGPSEFEKHLVAGQFEEGELVSLGGGFAFALDVAEFLVERDGVVEILDADAGMEEADHSGWKVGQSGRFAKPRILTAAHFPCCAE